MQDGNFFTYIVASLTQTLYIGITRDIEKRIFDHKCKLLEGFASTYNCDRLVWFESFDDPQSAIAREKQLKGWTRAKKIALIEKTNPAWTDLSEEWWTSEQAVWAQK